jgi:uncharacterized protein
MKQLLVTFLLTVIFCNSLTAQDKVYTDSLKKFQQKYVQEHEVVTGKNKKLFRFFPVNKTYLMSCTFEAITDTVGFIMKTSGSISKKHYRYGKLHFTINRTEQELTIYQSDKLMNTPEYADYLFVPFTDATTGDETYGSGRYLDLRLGDIKNNTVLLDFNKCYNPYCAYTSGYNCPIPPKENRLSIAIKAGEKVSFALIQDALGKNTLNYFPITSSVKIILRY